MDWLDLSPPSQPAYPTDAGADDVAPLSVVRPGKIPSSHALTPAGATSFARVQTNLASAYLRGLNRHWHRNVQVLAHSAAHVEILFPLGRSEFDASADSLEISLTSRSNYDAALLEDLVSEALDRLALSEELQYHWIRPAPRADLDVPVGTQHPRKFFSSRWSERPIPQHGSRQ